MERSSRPKGKKKGDTFPLVECCLQQQLWAKLFAQRQVTRVSSVPLHPGLRTQPVIHPVQFFSLVQTKLLKILYTTSHVFIFEMILTALFFRKKKKKSGFVDFLIQKSIFLQHFIGAINWDRFTLR